MLVRTGAMGIAGLLSVWVAASACAKEPAKLAAESDPERVTPAAVGSKAPDANVVTLDGKATALTAALAGKPTVVIFYRGGWCPYCNKHLAEVAQRRDELTAMGYQVVAISPDTAASMKKAGAEHSIEYTLLSDARMEAIGAWGLAFKLDAETLKKLDGYGITVQSAPDSEDKLLPVPAVFIVDRQGVIRYRHFEPDYRKRLSADDLIAAAKAAQAG